MPALISLSVEECWRLLAGAVVGRVGFDSGAGPRIYPVNYALDGRTVVLSTAVGSELADLVGDGSAAREGWHPVAFEVDRVDYEWHQGWSVLLVGALVPVRDECALERIRRGWSPRPWADGRRSLILRVRPEEVSGRRLGGDVTGQEPTAVRRTV